MTEAPNTSLVQPRAGRGYFLGDIAPLDPRLAYVLYQAGLAPGGYVDVGGWEIINIRGTWATTDANQTVRGQFDGLVEADLWVKDVQYTVKRPNAFAGSIFKPQADYFNMKNPNIDFQLIINSYCRYLISPTFTPLENIKQAFSRCCSELGLVLRCSARPEAQFTNTRTLADDEIPTIAVISMHAIRLPREAYGACNIEHAVEAMRGAGFLKAA